MGCFFIFASSNSPKMSQKPIKCFRCVDDKNLMLKNGKTRSGKQRYLCKICKATRVENYTYCAYQSNIDQQIMLLTKEGLGIRSTARVLQISTTTLLKRILLVAKSIKQPMIPIGKEYEVDELCTFIGKKSMRVWLVCALERKSRKIVSFNIGRRTSHTLKK